MQTLVSNIIFLSVLVFAAALVIFGLLKFIKVLKGELSVGEALMAIGGVVIGAAVVIWAATDFNGSRIIIDTVGKWIIQILTEPLG
ncbi:MAG: hypothetical protein KatS3mg101_0783 [Patescibacteria group bacterium]|nr:MAG: hypothetical protein KatS3mg101_0783 [Patescibacteria group bacterium]